MNVVWQVAAREVRTRLFAKATIISTLVVLVLIVAGVVAVKIIGDNDAASAGEQVGIAAETADLGPGLIAAAEAAGYPIELTETTSRDATTAITDGDLAAFVSGDPQAPVLLVEDSPAPELLTALTTASQQYVMSSAISDLGGDPAQIGADVAAAAPTVEALSTDESEFDPYAFIVAIVTCSLLLFTLLQSGSLIAMGVVEEKVSRVVEILLATIRPAQLMGGKVLGIGIVGLVQLVVFGGAAAIAAAATGLLDGVDLNLGSAFVWMLVWFFLGFALYAVLFGGFAALVSRQEDIGAVTTPMIFGMMAPFYLAIYLVPSLPDSPVVRILSQVPFFAPFMMPVRQAFDSVEVWELALSIALCVAFVPLLVWLSGRVYSRAVLNTGGRMKLKDALAR
ncbi:ABC transporter permease [Occultella aeris]|uniref:ABC-2 family transporter protein n=1 Tax=Occultella aeris TaxID=2761496 RepID=A0A7M4DKS5_9MICO|nr:ABC transporter permease [Occultella aeris]VZO37794.1 ABC-2 family transporter protein [Occultella aeris]